jgi:23S rRNA pseudouridine2604 synthase
MSIIGKNARQYLVIKLGISNKEATALLVAQKLLVNGKLAAPDKPITTDDLVELDGKIIQTPETYHYLAYHKPRGIECTLNKDIPDNLAEALDFPERVFPAGRLDKESEGLLLLTDDGYTFEKIIHSNSHQEKEYIVTVDKPLVEEAINRLRSGVEVMKQMTREAKVELLDEYTFRIVLTQGLNRQIRRMCHKIGYEVTQLRRIRIINILLGDLPAGKWRLLAAQELAELKEKLG